MHMIDIDRAESKAEIPAEQVEWVFGGSQASSARILTLLLDKYRPQCITPPSLIFILNYYIYVKNDCALGL
jgi:hypothetical protein